MSAMKEGPSGLQGTSSFDGAPANGARSLKLGVGGMTCGSCVGRVERALLGVDGVYSARVNLATATVDVQYDPTRTGLPGLEVAIQAAGYEPRRRGESEAEPERFSLPLSPGALAFPAIAGLHAALALAGVYVVFLGVVQSFDHAFELLTGDWYLVVPIVLGFGAQVGLFVYARRALRLRKGSGASTALAGTGTGTSTISMVACCAHHITDVAPLLGIAGATLFLNEYRQPLMVFGILVNLVGIFVMVRMIRRMQQGKACARV